MQIHYLGLADYAPTLAAMQTFTANRTADTPDQLWLCQHPPVYTLGAAADMAHLLQTGSTIPVVETNRGGQVTYHGPGQVVAYPLIDMGRKRLFAKEYVHRLEEAIIQTLAHWQIHGARISGAPGIYVPLAPSVSSPPSSPASANTNSADRFAGWGKIAALGIKISRQCSYHGLALNVAMDLSPFNQINPCGYAGLQTVDFSTIGVHAQWGEVARQLAHQLEQQLG